MPAEVLGEIPSSGRVRESGRQASDGVSSRSANSDCDRVGSVSRRRSQLTSVTSAVTSAPTPNASSALNPVLGSAAAPAPAKEVSVPPTIKNRIVEVEPAEPSPGPVHDDDSIPAPTFSSGGSDAPTFAALGEQDSGGARSSKKTLIAAAAVLAIAALGYLGYGYLVKSAPTPRPASAPQEPAIRPMSSPVEAPAKPTPDSASITTQPSTSFRTAAAAGNSSTGATKSSGDSRRSNPGCRQCNRRP